MLVQCCGGSTVACGSLLVSVSLLGWVLCLRYLIVGVGFVCVKFIVGTGFIFFCLGHCVVSLLGRVYCFVGLFVGPGFIVGPMSLFVLVQYCGGSIVSCCSLLGWVSLLGGFIVFSI